jgi:tRNA U38,U39,U40 pseudouridine synthase TruA
VEARGRGHLLGPEVVVRSCELVDPEFDARYSAQWRRYRCTIINRPVPDPFRDRFTWWIPEPLELRVATGGGSLRW